MSKFQKNAGYFKYRPKKSMKLKCRRKRDRWQHGSDEPWPSGWKASDLRILRKVEVPDTDESSCDDGYEVRYTVKFPPYIKTIGQAKDYLSAIFYMGCNCSHDCCGHFFSNVWTHTLRRTKRKEHTILVGYARNV